MKFTEFNLNDRLLEAISYMGFDEATPIQEMAIPEIMNENDLIACAQTGTGKTAAFILPVLNKLTGVKSSSINTLIIVPTRELALQIDQQIQGFSYFVPVSSLPVYGGGDGNDFETERKALLGNSDIIVATPGKLISHLKMGYVKFNDIKHLILDEADKMLDMGFYDDIQKIISYIPKNRQTLMFSATMPPKIRVLASQILKNPKEISIELSKPAEGVLQASYLVYDNQKTVLIKYLLLNKPEYNSILIFTSTKSKVSEIVRELKRKDFEIEGISSDLEQQQREEVLSRFRSKKTRILVATDVLSRGIDIKDINLIINYDVPGDAEDYVHRVGRTARANTTGVALTLINENDMQKFRRIEELIEREIIKIPVPAELGESPAWNPRPFHKHSKPRYKRRKGK
ncbi:MAG: ATP-dependent RNA helicase [Bacteroidetes bacterium GWC2_33_15]|nr:MAG: ATP-dependent RNA helicase [Bacteroidetes bacterium GWA2_33_15]OFX49369.1 MAG: ATP-dependent RNA helicase [Bacteroidetes bacterium GWC2_33_15]OFX63039.1 MAG: ATP-dependent RNA helicase [Bacteroidetes bacterium GWB2_32_14]OFX68716.1 MAG: ATP-dependent RNA helicase [Bacteroidetes bacterium GWD2_33_33]HAN19116.1 ATP-dependent RNA helicase [Bacteroidales bacterium]